MHSQILVYFGTDILHHLLTPLFAKIYKVGALSSTGVTNDINKIYQDPETGAAEWDSALIILLFTPGFFSDISNVFSEKGLFSTKTKTKEDFFATNNRLCRCHRTILLTKTVEKHKRTIHFIDNSKKYKPMPIYLFALMTSHSKSIKNRKCDFFLNVGFDNTNLGRMTSSLSNLLFQLNFTIT